MSPSSLLARAEVLISATGSRQTGARVRVLAFLLAQKTAVTHHEIEAALDGGDRIDRVTLYRTLDWLLAQRLAHKVLSEDRVWRFRANESAEAHRQHAHFQCERCASVTCLAGTAATARSLALPEGYRAMEIDMTVKGLCPACTD